MTRRALPKRTHSSCCWALVERGRCSECNQLAPARQRVTAEEAARVTDRLAAVAHAPLTTAQALATLYGGYDD